MQTLYQSGKVTGSQGIRASGPFTLVVGPSLLAKPGQKLGHRILAKWFSVSGTVILKEMESEICGRGLKGECMCMSRCRD